LSSLICRSKLPCWVISGIPRLLNIPIRTILRWVVLRLNHHFEEISIARWPASLSQWPCHGESKILYSQGWPRCSGRSNIRYLPNPGFGISSMHFPLEKPSKACSSWLWPLLKWLWLLTFQLLSRRLSPSSKSTQI
jgi:hypothetical protein